MSLTWIPREGTPEAIEHWNKLRAKIVFPEPQKPAKPITIAYHLLEASRLNTKLEKNNIDNKDYKVNADSLREM